MKKKTTTKAKMDCFGFTCGIPGCEWTVSTTIFTPVPKKTHQGGMQGATPYTHEQFLEKLRKINTYIEPISEYHRSLEKMHVKCNMCGHDWMVLPHNLLLGRGCPKCHGCGGDKKVVDTPTSSKPIVVEKKHKRQYRELNETTKKKISAATEGKPKSKTHKRNISIALKKYWSSVPSKNDEVVATDAKN